MEALPPITAPPQTITDRPISTLCPTRTRASIFEAAPIWVGSMVPATTTVPPPMSTSSPISTPPRCASCWGFEGSRNEYPKPSAPTTQVLKNRQRSPARTPSYRTALAPTRQSSPRHDARPNHCPRFDLARAWYGRAITNPAAISVLEFRLASPKIAKPTQQVADASLGVRHPHGSDTLGLLGIHGNQNLGAPRYLAAKFFSRRDKMYGP